MSDTRDEAYRIFCESGQAGEAAKAVFSEIFKRGDEGATCFEIEEALGMKHETASGRITPLRSKHALIYYDGTTRVNPDSGRRCEVYKIVRDLEEAQRKDPRCGNDKANTAFVDITVLGQDDPEDPECPETVQYSFTCEGYKSGQTTLEFDWPEAVTIYPGDKVTMKWRYK
jgi:hypothetical protein